jgi:hypothetical protein
VPTTNQFLRQRSYVNISTKSEMPKRNTNDGLKESQILTPLSSQSSSASTKARRSTGEMTLLRLASPKDC